MPFRLATGQYDGADEIRTRIQKQYHTRNLILTLQALSYFIGVRVTIRSLSHYVHSRSERVLIGLLRHLTKPIQE